MTRTLEQRQILDAAGKIKRDEKKARHKTNKAAAIKHVQAWRDSTLPGAKDKRQKDAKFLGFVRRQPCAAAHLGGCEGWVEAAHIRYSCAAAGVRNPGLQAKNHDRHANPLCAHHHHCDQHKRREQDFWSDVGVDAYANAARLYAAFLTGSDGPSGIEAQAASARASMRDDRSVHADANTCFVSTITSEGAG